MRKLNSSVIMHRGATTKLGPATSKTGRVSLEIWPVYRFHQELDTTEVDMSSRAKMIYPVDHERMWEIVRHADPAWWAKNQHIVAKIIAGDPYTADDLVRIDLTPNESTAPSAYASMPDARSMQGEQWTEFCRSVGSPPLNV